MEYSLIITCNNTCHASPWKRTPFEADHTTHTFKDNVSFENIIELYIFDRELRLLIMDAIERIEVSIRTRWAYHLAHSHGSHAYMDESIFDDDEKYSRCLQALEEEFDRSTETFVTHYFTKYNEPYLPPIWAAVEVMSLGQLSKWYSNLKYRRDKQSIATTFYLDERVLRSFLHHLTIVRNLCAHHGRLWNRSFAFQMRVPNHPVPLAATVNKAAPKKIYNTLVMLEYLMNIISLNHHWKERLFGLFSEHPIVVLGAMGFPHNWQDLPIWKK